MSRLALRIPDQWCREGSLYRCQVSSGAEPPGGLLGQVKLSAQFLDALTSNASVSLSTEADYHQ